jgi:1,4-dihydroxy-2-naphthoyl-CoA hydrolase
MSIWSIEPTLEGLNLSFDQTMVAHLGIEFTGFGDDFVQARMPVDHRTVQPAGILHGGASVALAETLGSMAASLCIDPVRKFCVGLEINANHVRSMRSGWVIGTARPIHIGNSTHIWEIRITDEADRLVCIARLTMAVLDRERTG